ncbi:MAG: glycerol kinase GlpK [Caldisericia bacterium]|jgi:glycerol kinase|nr:glycerol kinase GlpK [Caldisericia bacterium]
MKKKYVLVIDQGTTSTRAIIFNDSGEIEHVEKMEITQIYPKPGWVEHNPEEIFDSALKTIKNSLNALNLEPKDILTIGITNQRETTILFEKESGKPVYNAIVWQCRRSAEICEEIKKEDLNEEIHKKTGLVIDPYFSLTKVVYLLREREDIKKRVLNGEVLFGTVDTYLLYRLTKGESFFTDYSNASRTMMFNINNLEWDKDILKNFSIPEHILPQVKDSSSLFGKVHKDYFGSEIPITGIVGDQQGSLFGELCIEEGMVKNTYGTGCFILLNTGKEKVLSKNGLLTTIAWGINGNVTFALEGSIFIAGALVQWLRDGINIINNSNEIEKLAKEVQDSEGVYIVPAFVGLGTPYWDMYAGGLIIGITRKTNKSHIARAALEAIAFQTRDVIEVMENETQKKIKVLRVDGGAAMNDLLLQIQSDFLGIKVERPKILETTAFGTFLLASLGLGIIKFENLKDFERIEKIFTSQIDEKLREKKYKIWKEAVKRSLGWRKIMM